MSGIEVIASDLKLSPRCPHGPTILFSRSFNDKKRQFFACSACRFRKDCSFFMWADDELSKEKTNYWNQEINNFLKGTDHQKSFQILQNMKQLPISERIYCHDCSICVLPKFLKIHSNHKLEKNLTNERLLNPSKFLQPLESNRKEAQYLFTEKTTQTIVNIMRKLNLRNILCIGTPKIFEYVLNNYDDMTPLLMDIDKRYMNFISPLQFCWYNLFNNHFFLQESTQIFQDFIHTDRGNNFVIVMDPPFGGRVEPISWTLNTINKMYKTLNKIKEDISIMLVFPYFMESHVINNLPEFKMLDYKVDYDNHGLFKNKCGRKYGSPVRIFTNINLSLIELPQSEGYKFCKKCKKWVSSENQHCKKCDSCTSKDGRTYLHCDLCDRCVKPTWRHCEKCNRCTQIDHLCGEIQFSQACFICSEKGHKKSECVKFISNEQPKRKKGKKHGKKKQKT